MWQVHTHTHSTQSTAPANKLLWQHAAAASIALRYVRRIELDLHIVEVALALRDVVGGVGACVDARQHIFHTLYVCGRP